MGKSPSSSSSSLPAPSSSRHPRQWALILIAFFMGVFSMFQIALVSHHTQHSVVDLGGSSSSSSSFRAPDRIAWKLRTKNHPVSDDSRQHSTTSKRSSIIVAKNNATVVNGETSTAPAVDHQSETTNTNNGSSMVRFLFGIMSYDHKLERRRRKNIRRTYLSFYEDFFSETTPYRICALVDWLQAPSDHPMLDQCQIIYTFVVGANPNGPTQLLVFNESFPLVIDPSQIPGAERDVTYLNIQENGRYGKSPTWFKYGLAVLDKTNDEQQQEKQQQQQQQHASPRRVSFDYIVKTDSDAALYPSSFFDMVQRHQLRPYPNNPLVYGGSPFDKYMCGYPEHDHCVQLQTPTYMGGAFYFLSLDLADYITSPDCPRSQLFFPHEDMTTGNYVYSHPQRDKITWVKELKGYEHIWRHAVKNPNRLVHFYVQYLKRLAQEGMVSETQIQAWNQSFRSNSYE